MNHPEWCDRTTCTATVGGVHKSPSHSIEVDGRTVFRLWVQAANGDSPELVAASPADPVRMDVDTASRCAALWAETVMLLIEATG